MSPLLSGIVRVSAAAFIWGAAYPLTKLALADIPPVFLGFLRFAMAGLILMMMTRSMPLQGVAPQDRKCFIKLAFWGVFVLVLGMNYGLIWAPGIAASVLSGTPPLFTVFLAYLYLNEKIRVVHFLSFALAIGGITLLGSGVEGKPGLENWQIWVGCLLTLIPQFAWAMYGITGKRLSSRYSWQMICRDTFSLGALMLLPIALIESTVYGSGTINLTSGLILLYLALMNSVVTYALWNSSLKLIPVTLASFLIYLQPVSGAIISHSLFGENLGIYGIAGTSLIFVALTLIIVPERRNAENKKEDI